MKNCPKCGAPLKETTHIGVTVEECNSCGYWHNTATGEVKTLDVSGKTFLVQCPACSSKLRIKGTPSDPVIHIGDTVTCSFCNADFQVPEMPDAALHAIVACPHCSGKSRVPANKGNLSVTCTQCKEKFLYDSGTWPVKAPAAQQAASYTNTYTQAAASTNECYQCPKCGWTHPNTSALNEEIAAHTPCGSCGNSYLIHLTWDD